MSDNESSSRSIAVVMAQAMRGAVSVTVSVLCLEGNRREYNISEKQWFRGGSQVKSG